MTKLGKAASGNSKLENAKSRKAKPEKQPRLIPVILVAGFSQPARHRVALDVISLARTASNKGVPVKLAWLDQVDTQVAIPETQASQAPTQRFSACVCCSGSLAFATYLARLLRQEPWDALMISLGAAAEPGRILTLLQQPPWAQRLGPVRLFSVMDELSHGLIRQPTHALHKAAIEQRELAEKVLTPDERLNGLMLFSNPWFTPRKTPL